MINIKHDIKYIPEAMSLLQRIGSGKNFDEYFYANARLFTATPEEIYLKKISIISFIKSIDTAFLNLFKNDLDTINLYFSPLYEEKGNWSVGKILLLWERLDANHQLNTYEDLLDYLSLDDDEKYNDRFSLLIQNFNNNYIDSSNITTYKNDKDVIKLILNMDYPKEKILILEDAYINRKNHLEKLLSIVSRTIDLLKTYDKDFKALITEYEKEWNELLGDTDFISYLMEQSSFFQKLTPNKLGYIIHPYIMHPFSLGMSSQKDSDTDEYTTPFTVSFGILYGKDFIPNMSYQKPDSLKERNYYLNLLKIISDPNRFKILKTIKEDSIYSSMLANELGLTAATMSHHTSQLLSNDIVKLKVEGNKSYFLSNRKIILECINFLEDSLL